MSQGLEEFMECLKEFMECMCPEPNALPCQILKASRSLWNNLKAEAQWKPHMTSCTSVGHCTCDCVISTLHKCKTNQIHNHPFPSPNASFKPTDLLSNKGLAKQKVLVLGEQKHAKGLDLEKGPLNPPQQLDRDVELQDDLALCYHPMHPITILGPSTMFLISTSLRGPPSGMYLPQPTPQGSLVSHKAHGINKENKFVLKDPLADIFGPNGMARTVPEPTLSSIKKPSDGSSTKVPKKKMRPGSAKNTRNLRAPCWLKQVKTDEYKANAECLQSVGTWMKGSDKAICDGTMY
ncbi:hypothetical protein EDB19DRAFT_1830797 [Suillus lakei]|nr:hypothetical protein EDB19DRAFT_1830797 [Suillus lakei]